MKVQRGLVMASVVWAGMVVPGIARAQWGDGTVTANGTASLERMPEIMRMRVDVPARGEDLKQALAKLKEKREAAVKKLAGLGVPEGAARFGDPKIGEGRIERMRRMMIMQGRIEEQETEEEGEEAKAGPVTVLSSLEAEWPLRSESTEDLLIQVHELQKKLKTMDIAGLKDDKLTPEEEEMLAEMEDESSRFMSYGGEQPAEPGEPTFLFVSRISEADRTRLLAEAFGKAKAEAESLAAAAGIELGPLSGLSSHRTEGYSQYDYNSPYFQVMQRARAMFDPEQTDHEAVGAEAAKVTYRITVSVAYKIK